MKISNTLFFIIVICIISVTYQSQSTRPKTKLIKEWRTNYTLAGTNGWNQFLTLKVSFYLVEPIHVYIGYTISNQCTPASHLVTRLIVDSTENQHFRVITGNSIYHTNAASGFVQLAAGKHEIRVQYRTPGTCSGNENDWSIPSLQVVY